MTCVTSASTLVEPQLPDARGPLSLAVLSQLTEHVPHHHLARIEASLGDSDPYALDLQLALYADELHYRGFAGVNPRWEWNPCSCCRYGPGSKRRSCSAVRHARRGHRAVTPRPQTEMDALSVEPIHGEGPSYFLRDKGQLGKQMREYFAHRSLYHLLKEGDPHAWAIPRLHRDRPRRPLSPSSSTSTAAAAASACISTCSPS